MTASIKEMIMKNKIYIIAFLAVAATFLATVVPNSYEEREGVILDGVLNFIDNIHINPKPIDDDFSKGVYDIYMERLDGGKRFLTQEDIDQLAVYETAIDDQVVRRTFEFFDKSVELIDAALIRSKKIYEKVIQQDFDFTKDESIELMNDKRSYAADEQELEDYWRKYIKYDILSKISRKTKANEKLKEKIKNGENEEVEDEPKTDEEILIEATEETEKAFERWFERVEKLRRSDRFEAYLGSITNYFDPHTDYFNPKQKEDFDINMGGKLEGIGARLTIDGEYTKVSDIIPGGPAWKGKELEVDDLITAVKEDGKEVLDITGMRLDDVVQHIRGKKGTKVTLTIKKEDGSIRDIVIERDEVIIDESFARSLILDFPGTINNVGYVKLPKFYSSFEKKDGNSCAADIARELEKLKDKKVNGIILDLRNNTGGSLRDVVEMTGLFIEDGPIVQVKANEKKPFVYEDEDPTIQYDGPLIVMVNHLSASASEILAAALQDYGRAIIVGSPSTFGKGTVQRFFDLDRGYRGNNDFKPLGNLKVSMQKFYRINGGSTQLKGVESDIVLPDNYMYIDTGEKDYDYALEWTEIEPVPGYSTVHKLENIDEIRAKSNKRVSENADFRLIDEGAKDFSKRREESTYPLSEKGYKSFMDTREEENKKYDQLFEDDVYGLKVHNLAVDTSAINIDDGKKARNEEWIKDVKKDIYLEETLYILKDMIRMEPQFSGISTRAVKMK